jgi:hypothetical protein
VAVVGFIFIALPVVNKIKELHVTPAKKEEAEMEFV